jgi:hypothetical protein
VTIELEVSQRPLVWYDEVTSKVALLISGEKYEELPFLLPSISNHISALFAPSHLKPNSPHQIRSLSNNNIPLPHKPARRQLRARNPGPNPKLHIIPLPKHLPNQHLFLLIQRFYRLRILEQCVELSRRGDAGGAC